MMLVSATSPTTLLADCAADVRLCDQAYQNKKKELEVSDLAIRQLQNNNSELVFEVKRLQEVNTAWYKNPYLLLGLGLIGGVLLAK